MAAGHGWSKFSDPPASVGTAAIRPFWAQQSSAAGVSPAVTDHALTSYSLIQQPRSADPVTVPFTSADPVTVPELATVPDPATAPDTATTDQAVHDNFSGEVARSAHDQLTPKPPDTQHVKFKETVAELAVNKSLSKSALKKVRKQLRDKN
ncbi:hypothetical protein RHGRI_020842 [Rhododendron griersonianum]|uniref:Uncharacterized protein n=1 Tax=Rhododendron griersonianum TaxID=479676 RepID=A0AAV6JQA2_9ERIC|nr:hypothetical protein RHGRI_020842 [Rhododendron griersonianum]